MSRPMVLVFLLVILIITSQFEWKQQLANELEAGPAISQKQQRIADREEAVKEKIILSQEKNIQRLNELVLTLQQQLLQCRSSVNKLNDSGNPFSTNISEIEQQQQQTLQD
ncbi:hypothetical protein J5N97_021337 [Dioscorea zingiberensis]|uniref:Uncharacterized protein n=1 Tax=Dioscorea zingiberensis TaxID=325984 RepID=A0A9D5CHG7_9LILI|nr:hypothetical protein J5N97_021337 [Dioscorea zingiberensis]